MLQLAALAFAVAANAAACPASPLIGAAAEPAAYQSSFDATLWGGEQVHQKYTISVTPSTAGGPTVAWTDGTAKAAQRLDVSLTACGVMKSSAIVASVQPINAALALAMGAPAEPKEADHWNSSVSVQVAQNQLIDVPVTVKVLSVSKDGVVLQASGDTTGTLTAFGAPFDLAYQGAAQFSAGKLVKSSSAAQESVQAGPQSQTMKFAWTVERG